MRRSVVALSLLTLGACGQGFELSRSSGSWESYRGSYIRDDGRVADDGQQGISHSEGQGYAMVLAEAAGDRATFDRVWNWARRNLQIRDDALLAWKWDPETGSVIDENNATDADLMVAWALLRAARRWGASGYQSEAWRLLDDIRSRLIIESFVGPVLLPGTSGFIHDGVATINLSYWVFPALTELARLDPEGPWAAVRSSGLKLIDSAQFGSDALPADWLQLSDPPAPSPLFPPRFGFEALRIPLYASWDGLNRYPGLASLATFWEDNDKPPVWVNLDDGTWAARKFRPGAMAIRELLLAGDADAKDDKRNAAPGTDYYDSTLLLLANLAADEQND